MIKQGPDLAVDYRVIHMLSNTPPHVDYSVYIRVSSNGTTHPLGKMRGKRYLRPLDKGHPLMIPPALDFIQSTDGCLALFASETHDLSAGHWRAGANVDNSGGYAPVTNEFST